MNRLIFLLVISLTACVGVDVLDIILVPPRLEITSYPTQLQVGDSFQLQAIKFDSVGAPVNAEVVWTVSNSAFAGINEAGQLVGLSEGTVDLAASLGALQDQVTLNITASETKSSQTLRTGTLQGVGGYDITGDFKIYQDSLTGKVLLEFIEASIDNSTPGPYYYLSNTTNSVNGGLSLGPAGSGNSIYELDEGVTVNTYDAVVVWCEPFGVTLGFGDFDE
jgi:hypothetical protein